MSIMALNDKSLSQMTGHEVPEIYVVIAKHEILGFDVKSISESIGATIEEVEEVLRDQIYKDIALIMKSEHAKTKTDVDLNWDGIEQVALERLFKRVQVEQDGDFLLKVAAVANRATRRTSQPALLDPASAGQRVPITLTRRITERIQQNGARERTVEEIQQVSISDGSATNPSFADVDSLLSVSTRPLLPKDVEVKTHSPADPTYDELEAEMIRKGY